MRRYLLIASESPSSPPRWQARRAAQNKPDTVERLIFAVPSGRTSYDAHREETFGVIHPLAPHYNTLLRTDPNDPTASKIVGDLAESWTISKDGRTYTREAPARASSSTTAAR